MEELVNENNNAENQSGFDRLCELQNLIKKESMQKELCK